MHRQKKLLYITDGTLLQVGSEMTRGCGLGSQVASGGPTGTPGAHWVPDAAAA